jgi:hypothetical protein
MEQFLNVETLVIELLLVVSLVAIVARADVQWSCRPLAGQFDGEQQA